MIIKLIKVKHYLISTIMLAYGLYILAKGKKLGYL